MLVDRLAKLAFVGAVIRGVGKGMVGAAKAVGKPLATVAAKRPLETGMAGLIGYSGVKAAVEKNRNFKAGFDPNQHRAMLGQPATPPGSEP